jgi:hypothetical protein
MAKKSTAPTKKGPAFAEVVMVYTKGSSHWYALVHPEIVTIEGLKFLAGAQVTGKDRHRMEGKRTLVPFEHVASIVEFQTEEDLWSEPQPRHIPAPPVPQSPLLTSHEQGGQKDEQKHHFRGEKHQHNRHRFKHRH